MKSAIFAPVLVHEADLLAVFRALRRCRRKHRHGHTVDCIRPHVIAPTAKAALDNLARLGLVMRRVVISHGARSYYWVLPIDCRPMRGDPFALEQVGRQGERLGRPVGRKKSGNFGKSVPLPRVAAPSHDH